MWFKIEYIIRQSHENLSNGSYNYKYNMRDLLLLHIYILWIIRYRIFTSKEQSIYKRALSHTDTHTHKHMLIIIIIIIIIIINESMCD